MSYLLLQVAGTIMVCICVINFAKLLQRYESSVVDFLLIIIATTRIVFIIMDYIVNEIMSYIFPQRR